MQREKGSHGLAIVLPIYTTGIRASLHVPRTHFICTSVTGTLLCVKLRTTLLVPGSLSPQSGTLKLKTL